MPESAFSALVWGRPVDPSSVGGISELRNIDLNLFYMIKELVLPINGYVSRYTETLSPSSQETDPITGLTVTPYVGQYNDWTYYNPDPTNPSLTGLITEPRLSTSGSLAFVNYPDGRVYYSGSQTQDITVTYDYYSVYVQDGFPDWGEELKDFADIRIPSVAIDHSSRTNEPFAIGGRYEEMRVFMVDILANSDPQRDDLTDLIETALRYDYPDTIDYRNGFPIHFNGDKNPSFDRGIANRWKHIRLYDASSQTIRAFTQTDKFRHRSVVTLSVQTN